MATPTAAQRSHALHQGHALPPLNGGGSGEARFPIENEGELVKAVKMVGLAKGNKDAIRRYIMRRARSMGLERLIPPHWKSGAVSEQAMDAIDLGIATEFALELAGHRPSKVTTGLGGSKVVHYGATKVIHHPSGKNARGGKRFGKKDPDTADGGTGNRRGGSGGSNSSTPKMTAADPDHDGDDDTLDPFDLNDESQLDAAIKAHKRSTNPKRMRKYLKARAKKMGHSDKIPSYWNDDGSLAYEED